MLWPLHWLRLLSTANDFTANPVLGNATLNRMGLHILRKRAALAICQWRRQRRRLKLPDGLAQQLSGQGFVRLDRFLPEDEFLAVKAELGRAALPVLEMAQPPALTRRMNLDANGCRGSYPALYRLITSETLLRLLRHASGYPGSPVIAIQCVHSSAHSQGQGHDPQTDWHVDTYHSTSKAWLFLHDVEMDEGPFAYVPGSNRATSARLAWEREQSLGAASHANRLHAKGSFRASEADLKNMGYGDPFIGAVKANTLIVADTAGFHRRTPSPQPTVRVEVYLSLRRNPFFAGLYPGLMSLPVLRNRWAGWAFQWCELLLKKGRPSWIPSPRRGLNTAELEVLR